MLLVCRMGWAQDRASVATARELGEEGLAACDAGDFEVAAQKLWQAYEVVKVPTLALHAGRALERLGRWVEAAELYLEATRLNTTGSDAALQDAARSDAAAAREALLPRIPRLVIALEGAAPNDVAVTIDGVPVPPSLLSAGKLVDPGEHQVAGRRGTKAIETRATTIEGRTATTTLRFPSDAAAARQPGAGTPELAPSSRGAPPDADRATRGRGQRVAGWISAGIGGAGLLLGTVASISLAQQKQDLEEGDCMNGECGRDEHDAVDRYNTLRPLATTGFVAGGLGIAAGTALLVTAPRESKAGRRIAPVIGWRSLGVEGRF
ncbi:MAG: hypothetical protein JW751_06440 [Polyangiaceae bacterium]|nr:hypothetical protein [Polyangiaceae bacterium]